MTQPSGQSPGGAHRNGGARRENGGHRLVGGAERRARVRVA